MYSNRLSSDILERFPNKTPTCILALSGGPDSVFLGELFTSILPKENIIAAHFDHKLRKDSHKDHDFCEQWAQKKRIPFVSEQWKKPQNSEEKARAARNAFLQITTEKYKANIVALGTHADDEAETILFHFLRGTGASGLSGMTMFDERTRFFRPLLRYTKKEILKYLNENNIGYVVDPTNLTNEYSRNFLRNDIFPLLEKRFPGCSNRIRRQAKVFSRIEDFLEQCSKDFLKMQKDKILKADFEKLHPAVQTEVIRHILKPKTPDSEQTETLRTFLLSAESGKKFSLGKTTVLVYSEYFFVEKSNG